MKVQKLVYNDYIHGMEFPANTIILHLDNRMEIACTDSRIKNGGLLVYVYKPFGKWKSEFLQNKYVKIIRDCSYKSNHKNFSVNCERLMKHERAHSKGGGGKISPTQIVTDYECSNNPLHDFRRATCVQWN